MRIEVTCPKCGSLLINYNELIDEQVGLTNDLALTWNANCADCDHDFHVVETYGLVSAVTEEW